MNNHSERADITQESRAARFSDRSQLIGLAIAGVALALAIVASTVAIAALVAVNDTPSTTSATDVDNETSDLQTPVTGDLTLPPANIPALIAQVSESVVWVECHAGVGTGWVIDTAAEPNVREALRDEYNPKSMVLVITAEHVIRSCVKRQEDPDVFVGERPVEATLLNWRKNTDIAVVAIEADLPGLAASVLTPQAAWALSIGFPWEFDKTVPLIGHVIDEDDTGLYLQMVVQPGNSGSPVVNAQGQAMGTVVASLGDEGEDYSLGWTNAVPIEALCEAMFSCDQTSITTSGKTAPNKS